MDNATRTELEAIARDWPIGSTVQRIHGSGNSHGPHLTVVSAENRNASQNGLGHVGSAYKARWNQNVFVVVIEGGEERGVRPNLLRMVRRAEETNVTESNEDPKKMYLLGWNDALDFLVDRSVALEPSERLLQHRGLN